VDDQPVSLVIGLTFLIGFAVGYGVREFISYRRRTAGRRKARKAHREEARRLGFKE
jgi:hypothetical protein